jgi:hypothetical protein
MESLRELRHCHHRKIVTSAYRALLGREPDGDGIEHYCRFLNNGGKVTDIARDVCSSSEFRLYYSYGKQVTESQSRQIKKQHHTLTYAETQVMAFWR